MYNSDKVKSGLFAVYEELFPKKDVKYLEVGIYHGGSIQWAADYFGPNSAIYGIDLNIPEVAFPKNVLLLKADQNDAKALDSIGKSQGSFDIIIDDGCHIKSETENTFNVLWGYLKPGGIYVIEDWGACYTSPIYFGMDVLVGSIVGRKQLLGIKAMKIVYNDKGNGTSYAVFWKE